MLQLSFDGGTLVLRDLDEKAKELLDDLISEDKRIGAWRASAHDYAVITRRLYKQIEVNDQARAYQELNILEQGARPLRPYQSEALQSWLQGKKRGVVVLPTGAGKTYVAIKAIAAVRRSVLVITPTIDLVQQWHGELAQRFDCPIGQYGGGEKQFENITVSTYDSAVQFMPYYGNKIGLLIVDECHHLPAEIYQTIARNCIAPFRLGLSATPEREDGSHAILDELLGPEIHRSGIEELEGEYLSEYQVELLEVPLDPDEAEVYHEEREVYLRFVRASGIMFSRPDGWSQFIVACARAPEGRRIMQAYREQKRIARASRAKLRLCWQLIKEHKGERIIIFTDDNATAYGIGKAMLLPVLTHHTKGAERKKMLNAFRDGTLPYLVTSRVLNEGVDVPEANIGIIISGTGSVREHVQRLGRILRPQEDKMAILYEMISAGTSEAYTSERRRSHRAFGYEEMKFDQDDYSMGDPG